ncbi:hypothetical protein BV089_01484B, partial [Haemophilus influenzae]
RKRHRPRLPFRQWHNRRRRS